MPSSFGKYTGGIVPVQGLFEMGAQIGKNYAAGINALSDNIAEGVNKYQTAKKEAEYADAEFDAEGARYTALAEMLGSEPETASLVEGITPILETIAKGRKGGHTAKLAALSQVKAQGKALNETFGYMDMVKKAKVNRLFGEANELPPEGEEVVTKSFGVNPQDTRWSPNLGYNDNVNRVRGNYRKWLDTHKDDLASGKFRVMSEDDFIKDWKRKLPSSIQNSDLAPQDKAWAMDILTNNNIFENTKPEDDNGVAAFFQDWATINPYRGTGSIDATTAPEGTIAQQPSSAPLGQYHPNAVVLQQENERLIQEAKRLQSRIGTGWLGGNDSADRPRLKEITKQLEANNLIINQLGGAPTPASEREAQMKQGYGIPAISFNNEDISEEIPSPVLTPDKVVESAPQAPAAVYRPFPSPPAAVYRPFPSAPQVPEAEAPPAAVYRPFPSAPAKVTSEAEAPMAPAKVAPAPAPVPVASAKVTSGEFPPDTGGEYIAKGRTTLMQIAERAGVTRKALMKANGVSMNHDFKKGDRIIVPPSVAQNNAADRNPESIEPIVAQISEEEAAGGTPPPENYIDPDTGNVVINTELVGLRNKPEEEAQDQVDGEGIDIEAFAPIKLKPLTGTSRTSSGSPLPSLPAGVKKIYTPEETEDIKLAARHIQETTAEVESQQRSVDPAIKYLESVRDNVINGDGTSVDYGTFGKWQKLHPDAAGAINTAAQAGALWYGGGWGKTIKFANSIEKVDFVARKSKIAREAATKIIDGIRKSGRVETPEEIARAVSVGLKQAGLANKQLSKELLYEGVGRVGGSITKSATWSAIINQMVGNEPYSVGDDINNKTIKEEIANVLEEVRVARQDQGGYSNIPFNTNPITEVEIRKIRKILDTKIAGLKQISQQNVSQLDSIKKNATPDNLLRLSRELENDSNAKLAAVEIAKANGLYDDPSAGIPTEDYGEIEIGAQQIASKDFVIPQSSESRKKQMTEYMKSRLGYIPAGFDDMWRKQYPESTLQIKETPYGVFFSDKTGEWKQMASTKGNQMEPKDVAANKAVQFGNLQPDGTYEPTEFIKGSGIKLGGIGTFGTASEASKFRMEYTRKIKALRYADELRQINETLFRSMMPSLWGKSSAKVASLVAQMRQELIGVGSVSDFEQKLLKDLVANPTDFFRLQSTVRATYEELIDKLSRSLVEDPQTYGLDVQMPKDRQAQVKNMRAIYLAQQERNKAKMAEFQKQDTTKYKYSQQYDESK